MSSLEPITEPAFLTSLFILLVLPCTCWRISVCSSLSCIQPRCWSSRSVCCRRARPGTCSLPPPQSSLRMLWGCVAVLFPEVDRHLPGLGHVQQQVVPPPVHHWCTQPLQSHQRTSAGGPAQRYTGSLRWTGMGTAQVFSVYDCFFIATFGVSVNSWLKSTDDPPPPANAPFSILIVFLSSLGLWCCWLHVIFLHWTNDLARQAELVIFCHPCDIFRLLLFFLSAVVMEDVSAFSVHLPAVSKLSVIALSWMKVNLGLFCFAVWELQLNLKVKLHLLFEAFKKKLISSSVASSKDWHESSKRAISSLCNGRTLLFWSISTFYSAFADLKWCRAVMQWFQTAGLTAASTANVHTVHYGGLAGGKKYIPQ